MAYYELWFCITGTKNIMDENEINTPFQIFQNRYRTGRMKMKYHASVVPWELYFPSVIPWENITLLVVHRNVIFHDRPGQYLYNISWYVLPNMHVPNRRILYTSNSMSSYLANIYVPCRNNNCPFHHTCVIHSILYRAYISLALSYWDV